MAQGIELLPKRKEEEKTWRTEKLGKGIFVVLAIYLLLTAGLLGAVILTSGQLSSASAQRQTLEKEIKGQEKKESLMVLLKDRASKEQAYFKDKVDYQGIFEIIANLTPEGVTLGETKIEKSKLAFGGTSTDLGSLREFLERLDVSLEAFSAAKLLSISRDKAGGYSFSLETSLSLSQLK